MVEKLLTNWMSICLYTFVRVREAGAGAGLGEAGWEGQPPPPVVGAGLSTTQLLAPRQLGHSCPASLSHLRPSAARPPPQCGPCLIQLRFMPIICPGGPHSLSLP